MPNTIAARSLAGLRSAAVAGIVLTLLVHPAIGAEEPSKPTAKEQPAALVVPAAAPKAATAPKGPVAPEAMDGLQFADLSPDQKALATSLLNENGCDCGCGMKVAVCRRDDSKCTRSLGIGKQVIDLVKQGKSRDEIVRVALSPPSKFVQFAISPGDAPSLGPASAKITVVHYFDFQCPFCQKVLPTLEQIRKDYPDDVRIVYKMHPLSIHPNAVPAAEAALAAGAQGKFFEMHKKLFDNQQKLTRDTFLALAKELGLDVARFTKELDDHTYLPAIQKQAKEVEDLGAMVTPVSFISGRVVNGAKPYDQFKDIIDEELGWAKAGKRPDFKIGKNISEATAKKEPTGPDPNKVYDLRAGDAPFRGPANAKVTILHYFDYQCPFCVRVAPTLEQILKSYPNDVRVVYKMHPLPIHSNAMNAAEAAQAAKAQNKFAEMSEKLMANSTALSRDKILQIATEIGLDMKRFTSDLDSLAHKAAIDAEAQEAISVGANGTPASFINGRFVSGAQPFEAFKAIIDSEIAKVTK
jgi:protein-disulfide isomerase